MDIWTGVRFLHVLAMAFFVGGQLMLVAAVVPAMRRRGDDAAMRTIAKHFGIGSAIALGLLVATGFAQADRLERWDSGTLQAKLGLVALVVVLIGVHVGAPRSRVLSGAVFLSSLVIVWLGVRLAHGGY